MISQKVYLRLKDPFFYLGMAALVAWFIDAYTKTFIQYAPYRLLWLSSVGLILLTIGSLWKSNLVITATFCLLIVPEGAWLLSFLAWLAFHFDLGKAVAYMFAPDFPQFYFLVTLYHVTLIPFIFATVILIKKIHPLGWLLAFFIATLLGTLTYLFANNNENINCINSPCEKLISFLYVLPNPGRIYVTTLLMTILIFWPVNYLLLLIHHKKIYEN